MICKRISDDIFRWAFFKKFEDKKIIFNVYLSNPNDTQFMR